MKIAYLANIRFPSERAHAVQIAHMCQAFAEFASVDLYVNRRHLGHLLEINEYFGIKAKFRVFRIPPHRIFPRLRFTFYLGEFWFAWHFLRAKHEVYDLIYVRSEWVVFFLVVFFRSDVKIVWESHEAKYNIVSRYILRRQVPVVVISQGIKDFYLKKEVTESQILVADDGIDDSFFAEPVTQTVAQKRLGLQSQKPVVMYIGGFEPWKGFETFCEASQLSAEYEWVVIGGTLEQVSVMKEKYSTVHFLGSKPYRDLSINQQAADVLVVPNSAKTPLGSLYTSPLKLFAHMSSGVPMVVSNVPSLISITGTKLVGVFEPDKASSLAATVRQVFDNLVITQGYAQELQKSAARYSWYMRAKHILDVLFK